MSTGDEAIRQYYARGCYMNRNGRFVSPTGMVRKPNLSSRGYLGVTVYIPGGRVRKMLIHRFAAFQKFGEAALVPGVQVRHLDSNPGNNRLSNIAIGTASDNAMDRPKQKRIASAKYANAQRLNPTIKADTAEKIAMEFARGMGPSELGRKYGLARCTVKNVLRRVSIKALLAKLKEKV